MGKELMKWLASIATGAAAAVLAWISGHMGAPTGVDPLVGGLAVALLTKVIGWLTSKLPTAPMIQ